MTAARQVAEGEALGLRYGAQPPALRGLNFALDAGSFHFLTGGSGSGKSSLLRLLFMEILPSIGRLRLFGKDVARMRRRERIAARRRIGVIFQDFRLLEHLNVLDNAALPLLASGESARNARARALEVLDWLEMRDHRDAMPSHLSGGEKQRVAIARAVIKKPQLLIADEPTGSVDEQSARRFFSLFRELPKTGTAVLIATHDETLARRYPYPALRLKDGSLAHAAPAAATQ